MLLSIVTINRNNANGLRETLRSVASQTGGEIEHVIVDGASTDDSVEVIKEYVREVETRKTRVSTILWKSEPDSGIYNAMNKGIAMAHGDYIQILNSGDRLASDEVTKRMIDRLSEEELPSILYGNMVKVFSDGHTLRDRCFAGQDITFLGFYTGTLNHSPAYIKRSLFDRYGKYDESYKIVSDWTWYMEAIVFGDETPVYADIDVTLFDMTGISETNTELTRRERRDYLEKRIHPSILKDYDEWSFAILQVRRLKRHPWAYRLVWILERVLFKWEKWTKSGASAV